ncbi:dolichyl-diphosphooligosaccharide--protein glycosyltransferase subunit 1-like [Diachasmimorpha longicaudata]|uniref:dolichyl-diphosphooligosaccharide--protein glycosyltransferase subunit 1-like n=1 Tax=Diachasmimorpha longicaudata TaxID=58733 RepID=UPI0030B872CA
MTMDLPNQPHLADRALDFTKPAKKDAESPILDLSCRKDHSPQRISYTLSPASSEPDLISPSSESHTSESSHHRLAFKDEQKNGFEGRTFMVTPPSETDSPKKLKYELTYPPQLAPTSSEMAHRYPLIPMNLPMPVAVSPVLPALLASQSGEAVKHIQLPILSPNTPSSNQEVSTPLVSPDSKKAPRPFKAYPKDPLALTMGPEIIYDQNSNDAYSEFRKRMLDSVRKTNEGTNIKMRRVTKSPSLPTSTMSILDDKDAAYWERRRKNNEAAKRSRDARRAKEDEIAIRAAFLEQENMKLKYELVALRKNLESFTKIKPFSMSDTTISYGPFEKRLPYTQEEFSVHFENNNKFLTVTRLERVLELSHWGNIAVEETIDLLHTGALLKGAFSRYEYSRESKSGQSSIQSFDTILPAAASDIYYRDEIGNISTSHTRVKKDSVDVSLRPRFPLFGGWKTHYTIGYNVPSYEYLFQNGEEFVLKMRVLDHVFDDMVVDELVLKIILPEGSHNLELSLPYAATRLPISLHYSYLDTFGRPVISVTKRNLVEHHIQDFKLKYNFPRILMLQEPLLVAMALYLLFLLVIIYVRLDFSIDKDEASESRLRIAGQCEKILAAQDKRVTSYNELDEQLVYLKANKDTAAFLSAMKAINQEYKNATNIVNELAQKLKSDSAEVYERIQDLQKSDKQLKEYYNQQQALYVDKLVPGKISRQQFVDAEGIITRKKEECVEKINAVVKSLH